MALEQQEYPRIPRTLTPDDIRQAVMDLIRDTLAWEIDEGPNGAEIKTRALYYITGVNDLATTLIERMEGNE